MLSQEEHQNNKAFDALKELGEKAAERGEYTEALTALEQAMIMAVDAHNFQEAINVLGHHLHIYKALYQKTGNSAYMELFFSDTQTGLHLTKEYGIQGQPKSVMQLRAGDYFLFKEQYEKAAEYYYEAHEELNKTRKEAPETEAEYLGHWGNAEVKSGKVADGIAKLEQALKTVKNNRNLRDFHHDVIQSGILLRLAEGYNTIGQLDKTLLFMKEAEQLVTRLATQHKMPNRKTQWEELKNKLGI